MISFSGEIFERMVKDLERLPTLFPRRRGLPYIEGLDVMNIMYLLHSSTAPLLSEKYYESGAAITRSGDR
jgi:hypothetical protein